MELFSQELALFVTANGNLDTRAMLIGGAAVVVAIGIMALMLRRNRK